MSRFNPNSSHPARAHQAWQILVSMAMNRQTTTYLGLSKLMYRKKAAGVLDKILGHIAFFCEDNDLPPLTTIVVNKNRGKPGKQIPVHPSAVDWERERVYDFDWYDVVPPTMDQLAEAFQARYG